MLESKIFPSRRSVLGIGWRSLTAAGIAGSLPQISHAAAGDRALVCLYLLGGYDGNSLLVPLDKSQYSAYAGIRGRLALSTDELLPVRAIKNPGEYGFHPALGELRDLYNLGALAVVANVGSPQPVPGHRYDSMAFLQGGSFTPAFAAAYSGSTISDGDSALTTNRGVSMVRLDGVRTLPHRPQIESAAGAVKFRTSFPPTAAGRALRQVAGLIQGARSTGLRRTVFTVPVGGFDTHREQVEAQASLFRELSSAIGAFYAALDESGMAREVTLFTDSEFGRSLAPNAAGGTNHGWGNHHLVVGGAVLGDDIYGTFPDMVSSARDANGGWVPTTSRDQYLSTLAKWAGMSDPEITRTFPTLGGERNLGFLS
jgi:uncharacterized protein (DUF1501 family)